MSYVFEINDLSLEEQLHAKLCYRPKPVLNIFGRSYGED